MIKKLNHRYYVYNHTGTKRLGPLIGFKTREEAVRRLCQIEFFKQQ